jgi:hypothetical protein
MDLLSGKRAVGPSTQLENYYHRMSTIKSEVWQAENEWRLMWRNDETQDKIYKCPINQTAIAKVFIGLAMPADIRKQLISAAKHHLPTVPLLQAYKRHGDLALRFERIRH